MLQKERASEQAAKVGSTRAQRSVAWQSEGRAQSNTSQEREGKKFAVSPHAGNKATLQAEYHTIHTHTHECGHNIQSTHGDPKFSQPSLAKQRARILAKRS